MFKLILLFLLFFQSIFLGQPLLSAPENHGPTVGLLFDESKRACPSTRGYYKRLAHILLNNADSNHRFGAFELDALRLELQHVVSKTEDSELSEFISRVLVFLDGTFPVNRSCRDCSICLDRLEDPVVWLSCEHSFCYECLFNWFVKHDPSREEDVHRSCPMCRTTILKCFQDVLKRDSRYDQMASDNAEERQRVRHEEERALFEHIQRARVANFLQSLLRTRILDSIIGNRSQEGDHDEDWTIFVYFDS